MQWIPCSMVRQDTIKLLEENIGKTFSDINLMNIFSSWNPLHSIGMLWAMLHKIHCIQSGSIAPKCMESSACNDAAWTPLHSIGMLWAMLHKIHCMQSCC